MPRIFDLPIEILLNVMLKLGDFHEIIIMCNSNIFLKKIYTRHKRYLFTKLYNVRGVIPSHSVFFYISRYEDKALSALYLQNEIKSIPRQIMVDHILSDDNFYRYCSLKDIFKITKKLRLRSSTLDKIINYYKKGDGKSVVLKLRFVKILHCITQNNLEGVYG
jgi:hypothetical protein